MRTFYNHFPYLFLCCLFVFGSIAGSFVNVCISRIPKGKSIIFPGSHCPACKHPIPFYYNIPIISYLILGGKCNKCRQRISLRYLAVELISACLVLVFFLRFGSGPDGLILYVFACVLLVVSCIDMEYQVIPDMITIPGTIVFSLVNLLILRTDIFSVTGGMATGSGILLMISMGYYLIRKQTGIGGGDIKFMAMIGAMTGIQGSLFTIFIASIFGSLAGILMMIHHVMIHKKTNMLQKIPFGPFLSVSALLYLFYGQKIIYWYLHIFLY